MLLDECGAAEVQAVMSFGTLRRGDRLQVDIHDPKVRGLIKGGYLKLVWKERGDVTGVDSAGDPDGPGLVSVGGVDPDDSGDSQAEEEVDDGPGEHRPEPEDPDGA